MTAIEVSMYSLGIVALLALVGPNAQAAKPKSSGQGCAVRETAAWYPNVAANPNPRLRPLSIQAVSSGRTCRTARVSITIKSAEGIVLHRDTFDADKVAGLYNARTPAQMRTELRTWINFRGTENYHESLPNWRVGQSEPDEREFPFTPAEGVTRAQYMAIKTNKTPIYCYVQGIESINCLVLQGGQLRPFGIQSFPG
jgi:hypothetical protein